MARAHSLAVTSVLIGVFGAPLGVAADPIRITSGTLEVGELGPASFVPSPIHLKGTRGFTLDAVGGDGRFGPGLDCFYGCSAGQTVSLDALWVGVDLNGTATLDGQFYDHVGGTTGDGAAGVAFRASLVLPPGQPESITLTVPFLFEGFFTRGFNGPEPIEERLVGSGSVTTTFERALTPGAGFYRPRSTVYTFASSVVPEPGTLTLLGTGLAAGLRAAFQRRRGRSSAGR